MCEGKEKKKLSQNRRGEWIQDPQRKELKNGGLIRFESVLKSMGGIREIEENKTAIKRDRYSRN